MHIILNRFAEIAQIMIAYCIFAEIRSLVRITASLIVHIVVLPLVLELSLVVAPKSFRRATLATVGEASSARLSRRNTSAE